MDSLAQLTQLARPSPSIEQMAQKLWTAQELEAMTPAEQDAIFEASIARNLDHAPQEFLARVRQRFEEHLGGQDSTTR